MSDASERHRSYNGDCINAHVHNELIQLPE
jgi:hypothetical protein